MRIDAYKERSEALLIQYSAIELADMVAQAELQIEALTAERDEYRKLWLDSLPVPDYGRPVEENKDEQ